MNGGRREANQDENAAEKEDAEKIAMPEGQQWRKRASLVRGLMEVGERNGND